MATASQAARHVFISVGRFRDLVGAGVFTRKPSGEYMLDEVREEYILNAQRVMAGRGSDSGAALSTQRTKLAAAQTASAEFKNKQAFGGYVELAVMQRVLEQLFLVFREQSLSLAGKVADACAGRDRAEIHEVIRREVCEMLEFMSDPNGMVAQAGAGK
jgi:hypothetical protein